MERTDLISGSAAARGCSAIRRFLTQLGAQLIGLPETEDDSARVAWWDDAASIARGGSVAATGSVMALRQVDLWVDEDLKQPAAIAASAPIPNRIEPNVQEFSETVEFSTSARREMKQSAESSGQGKRPRAGSFGIAKFLTVNGGVYDGRERGRWLDVSSDRKRTSFQLMKEGDAAAGSNFKVMRSLPRDFGGYCCR